MNDHIVLNAPLSSLRAMARESLAGRWPMAIAASFLYLALINGPLMLLDLFQEPSLGTLAANAPAMVSHNSMLSGNLLQQPWNLDFISVLESFYAMVVSGPLLLGFTLFLFSMFRERQASPVEVLYGFEHFWKSFCLMFVMNLFILFWTMLFLIPGFIAYYRYRLAFYLLAEHPEMGILQILSESKRLMRFNKWYLFQLDVSFLGWILLSILTAGLGAILLTPYMTMTGLIFYEMVNGRSGRPKLETLSDWEI